MDPAKLKVIELRAELGKRGLDTKGNKAVLVERLRLALEENPEDPIVEKSEGESNLSEEETGRSSRRAKEKTPEPSKLAPRTPSRSTRNAGTPTAVTPKTPTRSMRASAVAAKQSSLKSLKEESSEDEEEPPAKQQKLEAEKPVAPSPVTPEKIQQQDEQAPKIGQPVVDIEQHPISPAKNLEKSPTKPQESPMKPQSSPIKETPIQVRQSPVKVEQSPTKVEQSPTKAEQSPVKMQSPIKSQLLPVKELEQTPVKTASPVKPQIVQSPVKQQTVQSPVKQQPVQSPVKQQTVQSPAKQQISQSPVKQQTAQSPVKQQSPVKTPTKESEKMIVETEKSPKFAPRQSPTKAPVVSKPAEVATKDEQKVPKADDDEQETSSPKKKTESNSKKIEKMEVEDSASKAQNAKGDLTKDKQDVDMKEAKEESKTEDNSSQNERKRKRSPSPQEDNTSRQKPDDEPEINDENVLLSWYDSDLNLQIDQNSFMSATPLHKDGFGLVWAGARASYGFNKGKVFYEAKIVEKCSIDIHDETSPHILRVGWSVTGTSMQLGEERLSYAYDSTGKKTAECHFSDYGVAFDAGDVVISYLDMSDEKVVKIRFAVNDKDLDEAFVVNKEDLGDRALFPHVLSKNCTFTCNFGQEERWNKNLLDGYTPVGKVELKDRLAGPKRPITKEECEMVMMCGLPGSGKTYWCTKYASEHPEKMYNILGTNSIIEKMKVMGLPRKDNYQGRWETVLSMCTRALNTLLDKAYTRRRNYILDHHNVYPSAQKRKMRNFAGFSRRAVVIVPKEEDFKIRREQREKTEGKEVPDSTFLEMKASFAAPEVGEFISSVEWPDLEEQEAKKLIEQYNKEGKAAGYGQQSPHQKRSRMDSKDNRDNRLYNNRRGGGYQDRRNSGWRGGSNNGGWRDNRPTGRGHMRHGNFAGGPGGWRPRGPPPLVHRTGADRRGGDRRPGNDRLRPSAQRQGSWGGTSSYQGQQSNWNQQGSWSGSQSQGWNQSGWGGGNSQQWNNWTQKYGHGGNYGSSYNQSYDNGNYGGWNQQYYNQYWDQPQQSGQMAAGSQAGSASGSNYDYAEDCQDYMQT